VLGEVEAFTFPFQLQSNLTKYIMFIPLENQTLSIIPISEDMSTKREVNSPPQLIEERFVPYDLFQIVG